MADQSERFQCSLNPHYSRGECRHSDYTLWLCVGKCLPHRWQSVDTLQNLRWKKMYLRLWKILAFSPGGKSTFANIELYIWSVINSTWNGGAPVAELNPCAFDRASTACKQVFSHLPLCLPPLFPLLSLFLPHQGVWRGRFLWLSPLWINCFS